MKPQTATLMPRQQQMARNKEKKRIILRFLRDEIFTSADVLRALLGVSSRQAVYKTIKKFESDNLIKRHPVTVNGKHLITLFGITPHGVEMAFDLDENFEKRPYFEPSRVSISTLQHRLDLQLLHVRAEAAGWTSWVPGERLGFSEKNIKRPDAVATSPKGARFAIEVERTFKTRKRYTEIVGEHISGIEQKAWNAVLYVSPDDEFSKRLQRIFDDVSDYSVRDNLDQTIRVPFSPEKRKLFYFRHYNNWPTENNGG